jgi:signal transduction histidine kinase
MLKPTADKAEVTLELVKHGELLPLEVDRFQIEQALMNIVMNGIQAMPGGGLLRIELGLTRGTHPAHQKGGDRDFLVVKIVDNGSGIPEEDRERIFEPFFTTKKAGQGTGLGLSIVKGIIEEHGGWLKIESEPGRGTTIAVLLPLEGKV